ncbi:hypothetical protein Ancab_002360 [Ancistrocladus abbreviatus]
MSCTEEEELDDSNNVDYLSPQKIIGNKRDSRDTEFTGDDACSEDNYVGAGILNYEELGVRYMETLGLSADEEGDGPIKEGLKNAK